VGRPARKPDSEEAREDSDVSGKSRFETLAKIGDHFYRHHNRVTLVLSKSTLGRLIGTGSLPTESAKTDMLPRVVGWVMVSGAGVHAVNSCVSILTGALSGGTLDDNSAVQSEKNKALEEVVGSMYRGDGLDREACTHDVVFEDPAACCRGVDEVHEAFRALSKSCSPEALRPPTALASKSDCSLVLRLEQRYFGFLKVTSSVILTTEKDTGRISRIEERWNHAPLLDLGAPLRLSRRINGLISFAVTSRLL
jgi:hypothetical protein